MCRGNSSEKHCEEQSQLFEEGSLKELRSDTRYADGSQVLMRSLKSFCRETEMFPTFQTKFLKSEPDNMILQ